MFNAATHFVDRNVAEGRGIAGRHRVRRRADHLRRAAEQREPRRQRAARRSACAPRNACCCCCSTDRSSSTASSARSRSARCRSAQHAVEAGRLPVRDPRLARRCPDRQRRAAAGDRAHPARGSPVPAAHHRRRARRRLAAVVRAIRIAGERRARRRTDQPRRTGVLAVFLGQHGRAERVRAPAARHGGLRRAVRQRRARHPPDDRCFSVAKLFFAYGLGNALYFPFSVGATTILWPGPPTPQNVYAIIERHRPTLFFSVPTGYGMLLAHAERSRPARVRSVEHPPGRVGGRSAARVGI